MARLSYIRAVTPVVVLMVLSVFLAGAVNGATGLGFAIVSGAALALLLDAKTAVIMLSVIVPVLGSIQLLRHRAEVKHLGRLAPLFLGGLAGVPVGTVLLAVLPVQTVTLFLGALTLVYVVAGLLQVRFHVPVRWEPLLSPVVGVTGGVCSGAVGAAGPLLASYLLALDLPAGAFVFSLALMFSVNTLTRLVSLIALQQLTPGLLGLSLALTLPAVLGVMSGMSLQSRLDRRTFQRLVLGVLFVAGVSLVQRGLA